jgi:hypothetical protein
VTPLPSPDRPPIPGIASRSSRQSAASNILMVAAIGLANVGFCMNAWYARSLGATQTAEMLFLVVGVASDFVAPVMPCAAAGLWQSRQWGAALAGWVVWTSPLAFSARVGFASTNISDVTMVRASRETGPDVGPSGAQ